MNKEEHLSVVEDLVIDPGEVDAVVGLTDLEKAACLTDRQMGGIALKESDWYGQGKRHRMIFEDHDCCYHVMSRTTGGQRLFEDVEREAFRMIMKRVARFAGVDIVTYAIMTNHFHILLRVPERALVWQRFWVEGDPEKGIDEKGLLKHLRSLYSKSYLKQLRQELARMRQLNREDMVKETLQSYLDRMASLPVFMKELKERYTRWFNKRHERVGTLWMARYKSVLVEDGKALRTMAAYIDLNPVRAGLCEDPKDYRWCGYGEAMGALGKDADEQRRQLGTVFRSEEARASTDQTPMEWESGGAEWYRRLLLGEGKKSVEVKGANKKKRRGMDREKALEAFANGAKLSEAQLLRCRVRYFTDGLVIGSREFVNRYFERKREWFSPKRKSGARKMPVEEGGLYSMRQLKKRRVE